MAGPGGATAARPPPAPGGSRGPRPWAGWLLLANAAAMIAVAAVAARRPEPACTAEPRERWMPETTFLERVRREHRIVGIRGFEVTGANCYRVRTLRDGEAVEIDFDPVTGTTVRGGVQPR